MTQVRKASTKRHTVKKKKNSNASPKKSNSKKNIIVSEVEQKINNGIFLKNNMTSNHSYSELQFYKRFVFYILILPVFLGFENTLITLLLREINIGLFSILIVNILISLLLMLAIASLLFSDIKKIITLNRFYKERNEKK